jgi:hypothetical protein
MSLKQIDVADLDCVYLSYDEPNKEEHWVKIRNMVPWATRVDGIKGSDAAHKAAAEASATERFVLIDGDNLPDPAFFNQTFSFLTEEHEQAVFRWRARNHVNGLMYGNGGLSSWTRTYVQNMHTHENTDGRTETQVEFCFDPLYWAMHDCYSTTYPNGSAFHAWRAGFREGVKMSLDQGAKVTDLSTIWWQNYHRLLVWCSVGADVENGIYSILGAREGAALINCTEWDYANVRDFEWLTTYWNEHYENATEEEKTNQINFYGKELRDKCKLEIANLDSAGSKFFKTVYSNSPRIIRKR